jgi:hypothetical protein
MVHLTGRKNDFIVLEGDEYLSSNRCPEIPICISPHCFNSGIAWDHINVQRWKNYVEQFEISANKITKGGILVA